MNNLKHLSDFNLIIYKYAMSKQLSNDIAHSMWERIITFK